MSRSRKKHPVVSDYGSSTWFFKRQASRKVRYHKGHIPNGSHFKKLYCSWNIFDYKCHWFPSDIKEFDFFSQEDIDRAYRK